VNAANRAMELLKQYSRDGKELTLKHFAEDDSEGNAAVYSSIGVCVQLCVLSAYSLS
jgi:hypothetical protein